LHGQMHMKVTNQNIHIHIFGLTAALMEDATDEEDNRNCCSFMFDAFWLQVKAIESILL